MASLMEKIGVLVSASLHDLLNQAIQANSPAVLDEYIRRAEGNLDDLVITTAGVRGDLKSQTDKQEGLTRAISQMNDDIDLLVVAGKDAAAAIKIKQRIVKQTALDKASRAVLAYTADMDRLNQARGALEAKIAELRSARDRVETALAIAKTKQVTVRTLQDLNHILEDSGAEGIVEEAERRAATAEAALDMQMEKAGHLMDPLDDPDVLAELERTKQRLSVS